MRLSEILEPTNNNQTVTTKQIYYSVDGDNWYHYATATPSQDNAQLENTTRLNLERNPWKISPATSEQVQIMILVESKREVVHRELLKHYPGI